MIDLGINLFQEIAALGGGGGYSITNSLRFNDDDSAYLSRTPATAGNRKTWTWSGWVKRGNLGTTQNLFFSREAATAPLFGFYFVNDNLLIEYDDGASKNITTNAVFRDVSGWYHIVLTLDTTQAVASDRVKMYVNGEQIASFSVATYPALNQNLTVNSAYRFDMGGAFLSGGGSLFYLDGYLAEINFIDGQALTPDDFGEINATTGEWSPIAYSGTYGTNGFYLPFDGNANDDSGNGNNWTENNLASTDYMIDTPTNNFSVLTSLGGTGLTLSEGNLETYFASSTDEPAGSTIRFSSGKWYFEVVPLIDGDECGIGVINPVNGDYYVYFGQLARIYTDINGVSSFTSYGATYNTGAIIGVAYDADTGDLEFYKNNVSQGVVSTIFAGQEVSFLVYELSGTGAVSAISNFGADSSFAGNKTRQGNTDANGIGDFYYEPPAGYLALCTENTGGDPIADIT